MTSGSGSQARSALAQPGRRGVEPQLVIPRRVVELPTQECEHVVQQESRGTSACLKRDRVHVSKAHRLAKGIRAGSVWVNC
jgi:hypothetical protein